MTMYDQQTYQNKTRESVLSESCAIKEGDKQPPYDEGGGEKVGRSLMLYEVSGTEEDTISDIGTAPPEAVAVSTQMKRSSQQSSSSMISSLDTDSSRTSVNLPWVFGSDSLRITTVTLYNFSIWEELKSALKLSSWTILTVICGTGYEGRVTISKWYGIMETIHHYPIALGVAAGTYTVFEIENETL